MTELFQCDVVIVADEPDVLTDVPEALEAPIPVAKKQETGIDRSTVLWFAVVAAIALIPLIDAVIRMIWPQVPVVYQSGCW